ncbi:C-C motif chemokine 20b [Anarrhichthys ocellatus]|uniref:C-C motif chemokine 20b n=1 Tax=Anarrhichthys ocellatus TaxID=433405 RepID=UPI0012ED3421|nr:C-C motif chemokine 20-like [Anarrhichthys ocellatus]
MASSKVCLLAVLCSLVTLTTFIGSTRSASCCMMYTSRRLSCQRLMGYTIQKIVNSCDISAVIFHLPGRFVCANPSSKWTQRGVKCLDERRRKNSQITAKNTTSA